MEEKKLDKYIFNPEEVLGKGSFGIVYKGLRNLDGKSQVVALKKIPAEILQDKSKLQSLYNEISISGKINVEDIPYIIENKDRTKAGRTLPPHGLYLVKVEY